MEEEEAQTQVAYICIEGNERAALIKEVDAVKEREGVPPPGEVIAAIVGQAADCMLVRREGREVAIECLQAGSTKADNL